MERFIFDLVLNLFSFNLSYFAALILSNLLWLFPLILLYRHAWEQKKPSLLGFIFFIAMFYSVPAVMNLLGLKLWTTVFPIEYFALGSALTFLGKETFIESNGKAISFSLLFIMSFMVS